MPKYNRNFDLTLGDIDLIEAALRVVKRDLSLGREGARALLPVVEEGDRGGWSVCQRECCCQLRAKQFLHDSGSGSVAA